jgi:hypothetical protein
MIRHQPRTPNLPSGTPCFDRIYVHFHTSQMYLKSLPFLCTRVSCSSVQDWEKLRRLLMYVRGSLDEFLVLGADDLTVMNTWVDASYAVHKDFKSHTGGAVSFGRGAVVCKSAKQKLNTKSSTEAELVGASDYLPYPIWGKRLLKGQGYYLKENIFHQDNQSKPPNLPMDLFAPPFIYEIFRKTESKNNIYILCQLFLNRDTFHGERKPLLKTPCGILACGPLKRP